MRNKNLGSRGWEVKDKMRQYGGLEELILSVSRLRVFQNRREERSKVSIENRRRSFRIFGSEETLLGKDYRDEMSVGNLRINAFDEIDLLHVVVYYNRRYRVGTECLLDVV